MSQLLLLFKSSEDPREDPYLQAVQSSFPAVQAAIISPHEFRPCCPRLPRPDDADYNVVIFSSKRAVQFYAGLSGPSDRRRLTCYAVGPATAEAAAALGDFREVRGGAACGNAVALCDLVAAELRPDMDRILFPCGRVRKDTIEARLAGTLGFRLTALEVYDAVEKDSLASELDALLSSLGWTSLALAFFSPSSASMVLKSFSGGDCDLKLISIGPSTSQRLRDLRPDGKIFECASPSVDAFLAALSRCL